MKSLGIITITYDSYSDVRRTLRSIISLSDCCIVYIVHKRLTQDNEENIKKEFSLLDIHFFKQEKSGIYDAMNIGLNANNCDFTFFLNGGDELADTIDVMKPLFDEKNYDKVLVFDSLQIYGEDRYLRSSERSLIARDFKNIAHQAVIVPTALIGDNLFSLKKPISADTIWIERLLLKYPHKYMRRTLTKFYLGGISNFPSFKSVLLRFRDDGLQSSVNEIIKFLLTILVGNRRYYRIMCLRKR